MIDHQFRINEGRRPRIIYMTLSFCLSWIVFVFFVNSNVETIGGKVKTDKMPDKRCAFCFLLFAFCFLLFAFKFL